MKLLDIKDIDIFQIQMIKIEPNKKQHSAIPLYKRNRGLGSDFGFLTYNELHKLLITC